jgi:hypothetical protein
MTLVIADCFDISRANPFRRAGAARVALVLALDCL